MQTEPIAAGRARSDKTARRRTRHDVARPKAPTPLPDLLPAPVDARGRPLSPERIKWKVERRLLQEGLSPGELAFATATLDFSPGGQLTTASMKKIAKRAGMGRSTAFRVRNGLVARRLITTEQRYEDDGAQTTSKHAIAPAVFERAEVFFSGPPPSMGETGPRPGSGHKRDPLLDLDPSSGSGSLDLSDNGNQRARGRASLDPVFVQANEDPAFVELWTLHAAAHLAKWGREAQRRGEVYDPADAGSISPEHRAAVAAELRSLAARAHAFALAHFRDDLTPDAIRSVLTDRIVREFMALDRPYLRDHKHPLGCLWGKGGTDGKPCDLLSIGPRVLDAWCDALDPGESPPLDKLLEHADLEAARAACAELRARVAAAAAELPAPAVELDHQEHDAENDDDAAELPAPLPEGPPARAAIPPRGQRVTAEIRDELARIDAEAREHAEQQRARRDRTRRRDRARLATRPRERLALLAAMMALAAPPAPLDGPEHETPHHDPTAAPWTGAAPPLLRDARERPARRAPRRRRAPRARP